MCVKAEAGARMLMPACSMEMSGALYLDEPAWREESGWVAGGQGGYIQTMVGQQEQALQGFSAIATRLNYKAPTERALLSALVSPALRRVQDGAQTLTASVSAAQPRG